MPTSTTDHPRTLDLRPGDRVRVRSADEISSTLDERGMLDSMPFMPEMTQYCGRTFQVFKRADKTCTDRSHGMRRMNNAVHLGNLRCDGSAHGGCQAGCLIYWKEAWLERVGPHRESAPHHADPDAQDRLRQTLSSATTAPQKSETDAEIWQCQATEVPNATEWLHGWEVGQYVTDVRNWGLLKLLRFFVIEAFNRYQQLSLRRLPKQLLLRGGEEYPFVVGKLEKSEARPGTLDLHPGDWVRVKSKQEIERELEVGCMNRGLSFDREQLQYCGRTAQVRSRVNRLIDERNGRMIHIKSDCIILEGATCTGDYHRLCPKGIFPYWREAWLERIDAPPGAVAGRAGG